MTDTHTRSTTQGTYWTKTPAGPVEIWPLSAVQVRVTAGQSNNTEEASDPIAINGVSYDLRLTLTRVEAIEEEAEIVTEGNASTSGSNPLGHPERVWVESRGWARTFPNRYGQALKRSGPWTMEDATPAAQKALNGPILEAITETLEELGPELAQADTKARSEFAAGCADRIEELEALVTHWRDLAEEVTDRGAPLSGAWLLRSELGERSGPRPYLVDRLWTAILDRSR